MKPAPEPRFAKIAAMIADPTRARMLTHLLGSEHATAGELAHASGITAQTASAHLAKLADNALVVIRVQGRHRYYRLADGDIAHALEALSLVAERDVVTGSASDKWLHGAYRPLREARSCYGHLAGRLGVALHDALVERRALSYEGNAFRLTDDGRATLRTIGLEADRVKASRRCIVYPCLDWSERRDHMAGRLATTLLDHFMECRWLARLPQSRALRITPEGRRRFEAVL